MLETRSPDDSVDFVPLLTTCCLITFGCYFATAMRLPVMPLHARTFGVTTIQIGIINSVFYLMAGIFSLPSGFLSKKLGSRQLTVYGLIMLAAASFLLFFSTSFFQIAILYLVLGMGVAAFGPPMMTLVSEIAPATHLGRAYGWYTTALFCGLSLGPGVGGVLGQWIGLRPVFIIASICILLNLWAVITFMPKQHRTQKKSSPNQTGMMLDIKVLFKNHALLGCWLITFGGNMVIGMFFTFLPLHALYQGISVSQTGIIFLIQALVNAVSRIPFGILSDRISQRKYLVFVGVVLVGLAITGFGMATTFNQFIIAGIGLGMAHGLAFTSVGALIAETADKNLRGPAMGGYNTCLYLGMMTGSIVYGPIIEAIGFNRSFMLNGCLVAGFGVLFLCLMRGFLPPLNRGKKG
jgi:MFS family permease